MKIEANPGTDQQQEDKSNFRFGLVGELAMIANLNDEETYAMAGQGGDEDSDIERHDRDHDQVSQTTSVDAGLAEEGWVGFGAWSVFGHNGQYLNGDSEEEDEEESQDIHVEVVVRPVVEEDDDIFAPCEAAAHHHGTISCVRQVALGRRSHIWHVVHFSLCG